MTDNPYASHFVDQYVQTTSAIQQQKDQQTLREIQQQQLFIQQEQLREQQEKEDKQKGLDALEQQLDQSLGNSLAQLGGGGAEFQKGQFSSTGEFAQSRVKIVQDAAVKALQVGLGAKSEKLFKLAGQMAKDEATVRKDYSAGIKNDLENQKLQAELIARAARTSVDEKSFHANLKQIWPMLDAEDKKAVLSMQYSPELVKTLESQALDELELLRLQETQAQNAQSNADSAARLELDRTKVASLKEYRKEKLRIDSLKAKSSGKITSPTEKQVGQAIGFLRKSLLVDAGLADVEFKKLSQGAQDELSLAGATLASRTQKLLREDKSISGWDEAQARALIELQDSGELSVEVTDRWFTGLLGRKDSGKIKISQPQEFSPESFLQIAKSFDSGDFSAAPPETLFSVNGVTYRWDTKAKGFRKVSK